MQTVIRTLVNSPHHVLIYAGIAAALLLVFVPLVRASFGSRNKHDEDTSLNSISPSVLGLTFPAVDLKPTAVEFPTPSVSKVTAINEALTVPCIHCGVTISTRQNFCPACGYAQPVKQSFTAAFPA